MNPVVILLAAAFTGCVCLSGGLLILHWLKLRLRQGETLPVAFLLGAAALSTTVFTLLTFWVARPWCFALLGCGTIALAIRKRAWRIQQDPSGTDPLPRHWRWILAAALVFYGTYTFIYALAPEASPDGSAYHLGLVGRYFRTAGFTWYTENMYANLPMGVEMLYLFAYAFGRNSAAALVHWQFLMLLPFVLLAVGRRFGSAVTGAIAALIVFLCPVIMLDGSTAYVDTATGTVVAGLFLALSAWEQSQDRVWLPVIGVLAGWSYCCKMTAAPAVLLALVWIAWTMLRRREWRWRSILLAGGIAAATLAPWPIKNALIVGNPFSPFLNRYFPNPNVRISFEDDYRAQYRTYYGRITKWSEIPIEVTIRGGILNGLLGPLFLFAPVALLSLRWPLGRRAWLAALFMASTFPGNIGTRFLISAAPFVALAMAQLFERWRMGVAVVAFQLFFAWPDVIGAYGDQYAWRLDRFRWSAAWRIESEDTFLSRMLDGYRMAKLADALVPPDGRIFTYGGIAEAYTSRDVTIAYESGKGNAAGEIIATGVAGDLVACRAHVFQFPNRDLLRFRVIQTSNTTNIWSVSEVRPLNPAAREYDRQPWWRIKASPNPWDVSWAFDNCPVTRWKAWERSHPGEYIEVDFVRPVDLGGVRVDSSSDQPEVRMRVDGMLPDGKWITLSDKAEVKTLDAPSNVRRLASDDLKRMGYTHLIVANGEFLAKDVLDREADWGLTKLADSGTARLYRID